jgi:hypothetical protein
MCSFDSQVLGLPRVGCILSPVVRITHVLVVVSKQFVVVSKAILTWYLRGPRGKPRTTRGRLVHVFFDRGHDFGLLYRRVANSTIIQYLD